MRTTHEAPRCEHNRLASLQQYSGSAKLCKTPHGTLSKHPFRSCSFWLVTSSPHRYQGSSIAHLILVRSAACIVARRTSYFHDPFVPSYVLGAAGDRRQAQVIANRSSSTQRLCARLPDYLDTWLSECVLCNASQ